MSISRRLVNSAVARTGFTAVYAVISFFFMPFLIDHLGERWYGIWVVVTGLVANSYLLDMGMTTAVTRFVAKNVAEGDSRGANQVINTCLVIYTVLAGVILLLTLLLSAFAHRFVDSENDLRIIQAVIILIGFQYAAEFPFKAFAGVVSSYVRYDLLMLQRLMNVVLSTGLIVYFVGKGYGILSMAIIVVCVDQLANYFYYLLAKHLFRNLEISRVHFRRGLVKELFSYSSWSFVVQLAGQVRFRADTIVIGWLLSATSVTFFAVGQRLVEYFVEFVQKATNLMAPVFTKYYFEGNLTELRRQYLFVTRINAVLALFGGGMLIILGGPFLLRWMGPNFFESSYPVMVVLTIALSADLISIQSDNVLYAISKHRYLAIVNIIEATVKLALSIALAKPLGIVGVALGTAIPLLFSRLLIIPQYTGRCMTLTLWDFYRNLLPTILFTAAYLTVCGLIARPFLETPSYGAIVLTALAIFPAYLLAIPYVGFTAAERASLQNALPGAVQRFTAPFLAPRADSR